MPRVECPSCSNQLSVRDEHAGRTLRCPRCGSAVPPAPAQTTAPKPPDPRPRDDETDRRDDPLPPRKGPGLVVFLALFLLAGGVVTGIYLWQKGRNAAAERLRAERSTPNWRPAPVPVPRDEPDGPAVEVLAEDLARAYRDDRDAANGRYAGRWLLVEGRLTDDIPPDDDGARMAPSSLKFDGQPPSPGAPRGITVFCNLLPRGVGKELPGLSRDQRVQVKGYCTGYTTEGAVGPRVLLHNCRVEWYGPDPSVTLTAARLIEEYANDPKGTDAQYTGKQIIVTEAVVAEKPEDDVLVLTSASKTAGANIGATWPGTLPEQLRALRPGDVVRVKGEYAGSADGTIRLGRCRLAP
jgi:tRNA_anti-like